MQSVICAHWFVLLTLCIGLTVQASEPLKEDKSSPQAVIRLFYQAIANNQPDKAAALFSFKLLGLDDDAQVAAFRKELEMSFAEEFEILSAEHPKIKLIDMTQLKTLPEELAQYPACRSFKINDSVNEAQGGVEWSLCKEQGGWEIMFLLSTE